MPKGNTAIVEDCNRILAIFTHLLSSICYLLLCSQPFTEPASNPRMKNRPRKIYTSAVGSAAVMSPAITTFQSTENEPDRLFIATATGCDCGLGKIMTPNKKSLQMYVNWNIATTKKADNE